MYVVRFTCYNQTCDHAQLSSQICYTSKYTQVSPHSRVYIIYTCTAILVISLSDVYLYNLSFHTSHAAHICFNLFLKNNHPFHKTRPNFNSVVFYLFFKSLQTLNIYIHKFHSYIKPLLFYYIYYQKSIIKPCIVYLAGKDGSLLTWRLL